MNHGKPIRIILTAAFVIVPILLRAGGQPGGILMSGSSLHPDSVMLPASGQIHEETDLLRYLTPGMDELVIQRQPETENYFFRVFAMEGSGTGLTYLDQGPASLITLDNRFPAPFRDTIAPCIISYYPDSGASGIPVMADLLLVCSEHLHKDSGRISLTSGGSVVYSIAVGSDSVMLSGDSIRISLPVLDRNTRYAVHMDASCFADTAGNHLLLCATGQPASGSDTLWSFTTLSSGLFLSEYVEGSGYVKGFELFNPGTDTLSLDHYRMSYSRNGSGFTYRYYFPEGTMVAPRQAFLVMHEDVMEVPGYTLPEGCQADIMTGSIVSFNGNDALLLEKSIDQGASWYATDQFGYPGSTAIFDVAGTEGAAQDHTLLRKQGIRFGNTDWTASSGTGVLNSEWVVMPAGYLDNFGRPSPSFEIIPDTFVSVQEMLTEGVPGQPAWFAGEVFVSALSDTLGFAQDTTGGFMLVDTEGHMAGFSSGDKITALYGSLVDVPATAALRVQSAPERVTGHTDSLRAAELLIRDALLHSAQYNAMLVRIKNAGLHAATPVFVSDSGYWLNQGADSLALDIDLLNPGWYGQSIPEFVTASGILLESTGQPELLPRKLADLLTQVASYPYHPDTSVLAVPNPGNGLFLISDHQFSGKAMIRVFSMSGSLVFENIITEVMDTAIEIDIQDQPDSTYILFVTVEEYIIVKLLIKSE